MRKIYSLFLNFFILTLVTSCAYADDLATISLEPENPTPKSVVTITLQSYYFDVNLAMISWNVNGVLVLKGAGEKKLSIKTGNVGESKIVKVLAESADGTSVEQTINVTPSSVVLLYEAPESYVPLFYEGRSLPSDGAMVRFSALPQMSDGGAILSPSSLAYTWYLNDNIIESISGIGKQSAAIRLDYLTSKNEIRVLVRTPLGNKTEKTITVLPHPVMPLLYRYDAILGTNANALVEKRFEATNDFTIALEPFYVSQKRDAPATFSWLLDGLPSTPYGGKVLSLRPKEDSYGTSILVIKVAAQNELLQDAETTVEFIYDTRR